MRTGSGRRRGHTTYLSRGLGRCCWLWLRRRVRDNRRGRGGGRRRRGGKIGNGGGTGRTSSSCRGNVNGEVAFFEVNPSDVCFSSEIGGRFSRGRGGLRGNLLGSEI